MARGEMRYSSEGKQVQRFDNTPIPTNDYSLELLGDDMQVKRSEDKGPDAIPYVNVRFKALGTAAKEGQKDRLVFQKFLLSMKPGNDGVIMPARGGGIVEFCRSCGEEADFAIKTLTKSDNTTEDYFDSEEVLAYLQSKVGEVKSAHVVIEKVKDKDGNFVKGHPGNNKIGHWNLDTGAMTGKAPEEVPPPKAPVNGKVPLKKVGKK